MITMSFVGGFISGILTVVIVLCIIFIFKLYDLLRTLVDLMSDEIKKDNTYR